MNPNIFGMSVVIVVMVACYFDSGTAFAQENAMVSALDLEGDSDGDGVRNAFDRCPGNDDRMDKDEDGMPDACDECPGGLDTDKDGDSIPDGCDNCPDTYNPFEPRRRGDPLFKKDCECGSRPWRDCCWQSDEDGDGVGDRCEDWDRMQLQSVNNRSGDELESFEYDGNRLIRHVGWDSAHTVQTETRYVYDKYERIIGKVETAVDGSAEPRETTYFYDRFGDVIGALLSGEVGESNIFSYNDRNDRPYMQTTATDPPHQATILQYVTYNEKGHVLERYERIPDKETLVLVEYFLYRYSADGKREQETRSRVDDEHEQVVVEGYDQRGGRMWIKEYPELISPHGAALPKEHLLTRIETGQEDDDKGYISKHWRITIHPSGKRDVRRGYYIGERNTEGSTYVFETYVTHKEDPADEDKQEWHAKFSRYNTLTGYSNVTRVIEPDGSAVEYDFDPANPDFLISETRISKTDGSDVTRVRYEYDANGRITKEEHSGGEWAHVRETAYDFRGRATRVRVRDRNGLRETEYAYNAFDELVLSKESSFVRALIHDKRGRLKEELVFEHKGDLSRFELSKAGDFLQRTRYEHHPVSGRVTKTESVVGAGNSNELAPKETSEETYDETGTWILESRHSRDTTASSTLYKYDDQGRVVLTARSDGTSQYTDFDGRGMVAERSRYIGDRELAVTTYFYNDDGKVEVTIEASGEIDVYEYDETGRLRAIRTFPNRNAKRPSRVVSLDESSGIKSDISHDHK